MQLLILIIITIMATAIFWMSRKRNAWDIMFLNTTLAIVMLFMIGFLDNSLWDKIIYALGLVATGMGIAAILKEGQDS